MGLTKGFHDSRLRERVEVLGLTLTLDKLRRAIATRCLDRLARPWDEMLQWLLADKKQHRRPRPISLPRLTFKFQGRYYRLRGEVMKPVLA